MKTLTLKLTAVALLSVSAGANAAFLGFDDKAGNGQISINVHDFTQLSVNGTALRLDGEGRVSDFSKNIFADGVRHSFTGVFRTVSSVDINGKSASAAFGQNGSSGGYSFAISQSGDLATITGFFQGFKAGSSFAAQGLAIDPLTGTFSKRNLPTLEYGFTSEAVAPVPEPETYALMGMGLLGLMAARRRKLK